MCAKVYTIQNETFGPFYEFDANDANDANDAIKIKKNKKLIMS
jgi:hypothetical protein